MVLRMFIRLRARTGGHGRGVAFPRLAFFSMRRAAETSLTPIVLEYASARDHQHAEKCIAAGEA